MLNKFLKSEQNWVLPAIALFMLVAIGITNIPKQETWYQDIEDYQISSITPAELGSWIIEGRNDFLVFSIDTEATTSNIPGIVKLTSMEQVKELVATKPNYKKWILLTGPSGVPPEMAAILTQDWERRVILVKGGGAAWQEQISTTEVNYSNLTAKEAQDVKDVRSFFHKTTDPNAKQQIYIAPKAAPLPFLEKVEEEVVEEGC